MIIQITPILQFFLYAFVSFLITYLLYRKGRFDEVRKIEHTILTVAGVILPFVDVFETLIALKYGREGNPIINLTPPEYQFAFLATTHIGLSALAFSLGWKGRSQENVRIRFGLMLIVIFEAILTVINALLLKFYGFL